MDHLNSTMNENRDCPYVANSYNQPNENPESKRQKLNSKKDHENCEFGEADKKYLSSSLKTDATVDDVGHQYPLPITSKFHSADGKNFSVESNDCNTMKMPYRLLVQEPTDECEAFGHCVTAQLRQMPLMQKYLAQRLISEVCFRGQLQLLKLNTSVMTHRTPLQQLQKSAEAHAPSSVHPGNGNDYMVMAGYQQALRAQNQIPVNANSGTTTVGAYHNSVNTQMSDQSAGTMHHNMVNGISPENIQ